MFSIFQWEMESLFIWNSCTIIKRKYEDLLQITQKRLQGQRTIILSVILLNEPRTMHNSQSINRSPDHFVKIIAAQSNLFVGLGFGQMLIDVQGSRTRFGVSWRWRRAVRMENGLCPGLHWFQSPEISSDFKEIESSATRSWENQIEYTGVRNIF